MSRTVLFLAWAPFFSGAERALLMTLRALDGSRYAPVVIAGADGELTAQARTMGVPCRVLPIRQLSRRALLGSASALARVVAAAARIRPSLIHANDMPSYQPGGIAGRLLGVPALTHLRFPDSARGYRWFFRPRFSHAIFISESFRADAMAVAPDLFDGRSSVVYDAVGVPAVWSDAERAARRRALDLPPDAPIIALTGQISEVKGIWDFVAAAELLRDTSALFVVLGDDLRTHGELRRQMTAEVARLGLGARFRFLGFRQDAPDLVQLFDIVAVPSHVEPFGLASLEAMAAARPVVATRVGGIPEVVVDGETGLLVPARNPAALAAALSTLLHRPDLRARLGAAGHRRACDVFSPAAHGRALTAVYDRVLDTRD
jgi:glycosyltransferase involved in cell wall biosynthesis